jgi:hypothetical protein
VRETAAEAALLTCSGMEMMKKKKKKERKCKI